MSTSDRRIVAARKTEDAPKDTWPAPPPLSEDLFRDEMGRDTVPTPPPESGIADVPVIPKLREVDLETDPESDSDPG